MNFARQNLWQSYLPWFSAKWYPATNPEILKAKKDFSPFSSHVVKIALKLSSCYPSVERRQSVPPHPRASGPFAGELQNDHDC